MLLDLFNDEVTYDTAPAPSSKDKGTNCAHSLTEPEQPKGESNFVGLYNQGATCYMNSSLQVLYMTPQFRNLINSLFLCEKILGNPTEFIPQGRKYDIILCLQKLFSSLNLLNIKATKTEDLTKAFGWENNEGRDQHDSQEFIRILLFDVLENILFNTPFNNIINNIYKVNYISNMKCDKCGNVKTKIESEYVLNLQVMNMKNLEASLYSIFGFEEIIEGYKCENCNQKVNLKKWSKIISLPKYINFGLNRFIYDYNTFERVKLNNKFEFPLEINMKNFCDFGELNNSNNDDEYIYELYGVIVHSGTPYSGHYYAYIRDMTGQGKWKIIQKENKQIKENILNNKNEQEIMQTEENNKNEINEKKEEEKNGDEKNNNNTENNNKDNNQNNNENQNEINDEKDNGKGNKKNNKKKNKNKKEGKIERMKKQSKKNQNKEKGTSYNEDPNKDFSIPYNNKSLKDNWFEFNDTSVTPMPVCRLEKAFKGSNSAYMLFYAKKENLEKETELLPPPDYLRDFMNEFNEKIEKERIHYEEEKNSFIITIYEEKMFKLNKEDKILSLINNEEDNKFLVEKKYKFSDKVSILFQDEKLKNKKCFLFYIINKGEEKIVIIEKIINEEVGEITLKDVGFYHYCNVVFGGNESDIFDLNIIKIGKEYEPIDLKFFFNGNIFDLRTFGCYTISELKDILEKKINLKKDNFEISFMGGTKQIYLINDVIKNKNTGVEKNIKDLHLEKKNLLSIIPKDNCILEQNNENNNINNNNDKNLISCIVKFEDDESTVEIVKISLDKTFHDLYNTIYDKFPIIKEKTEIKEEQEQINEDKDKDKENNINNYKFRLFNELDNKIIGKESFPKKIITSPTFVEGDVRLRIEIGDIYSENEISLTILMKSLNKDNMEIEREFICDPKKYTLFQIKKFLLDNFITSEEKENLYKNYLLYRVNVYNLPVKPYKNEKDTLSVVGIKERDVLYLQNVMDIPNEMAYINIIYSDKETNYYDLIDYFEPLSFENKKKLELQIPKKTKIKELKEMINKDISPNLLLVRVIGKYNQLERILKNDNYDLKKYNLESPINLFVENLEEPLFNNNDNQEEKETKNKNNKKANNNKDNEIMIFLMQRNKKEDKYENKKRYIIQNDPNIFGTKELYDLCRIHSNWMNISIAKYNRGMYDYEEIKEYDENNNSISLKKGNYFLRDSDWVAIKNLDEDDDFATVFDKEKQIEIKKEKQRLKMLKIKEKAGKKSYEKPLRINLND